MYALELLSYYFDMKPMEFWSSNYRCVIKFCQVKLAKIVDEFKRQINLYEASTDKIIQANPLLYKNPKIERLIESFKDLFEEELQEQQKEQTLEEQIAIFRSMK